MEKPSTRDRCGRDGVWTSELQTQRSAERSDRERRRGVSARILDEPDRDERRSREEHRPANRHQGDRKNGRLLSARRAVRFSRRFIGHVHGRAGAGRDHAGHDEDKPGLDLRGSRRGKWFEGKRCGGETNQEDGDDKRSNPRPCSRSETNLGKTGVNWRHLQLAGMFAPLSIPRTADNACLPCGEFTRPSHIAAALSNVPF